jgi:hypothetical protein
MFRRMLAALVLLVIVAGLAPADYKGVITKINLKNNLVILKPDPDKDDVQAVFIDKDVKLIDKDGNELKDGIKNEMLKVGAKLEVKVEGKGKKDKKVSEVRIVEPAK